MSDIVEGSNAYITTTFRNLDGDLADPATVTSLIQAPDGTQTGPAPAHVSTGVWLTTVPATDSGLWFFNIVGSGPSAVDQGSFCVEPALVPV